MKTLRIAGRVVGEGEPCFVIAEAGVNHNGDIGLARKLIDVAKESGADAVKFQNFKAEKLVTRTAEKAEYQKRTTSADESQYDMIKKLELTSSMTKELFDFAAAKDVIFLSTPFDEGSADELEELGMPAFKIPSGEITNLLLLEHIAKKGKPIILSTGMATLKEVGEALNVIKRHGASDILIFHCVTSYPAKIEDMNLRAIKAMATRFRAPVGLSDHSPGTAIPIAAAALGAVAIEKHFTLDRNLPGPDHKASLEPADLARMIASIREVERAMGDGIKRVAAAEQDIRKIARRSIVAAADIPAGVLITEDMLALKRPGTGIEPKHINKIVGSRSTVAIKKDDLITWDMVGLPTQSSDQSALTTRGGGD